MWPDSFANQSGSGQQILTIIFTIAGKKFWLHLLRRKIWHLAEQNIALRSLTIASRVFNNHPSLAQICTLCLNNLGFVIRFTLAPEITITFLNNVISPAIHISPLRGTFFEFFAFSLRSLREPLSSAHQHIGTSLISSPLSSPQLVLKQSVTLLLNFIM